MPRPDHDTTWRGTCPHETVEIVANDFKTVKKNHPFQTLSPLPSAPTLFMPSFQSPVPIRGSSWLAKSITVLQRPDAVFVDRARFLTDGWCVEVFLLVVVKNR